MAARIWPLSPSSLNTDKNNVCSFFHSDRPICSKSIFLQVLYFNLNAYPSFSSSVLQSLTCPKGLKDHAWYLTFCSLNCLCSSRCPAGSVICLFSILCLLSRMYISGGRAELAFYVSMWPIELCPTPTWCSINIQEKMVPFRPYSEGLQGIVLCTKFRNKKPNPSKIASFCILHFDDVSKVWFPRFFMSLIYCKLPYISVVSNR